MLGLPFALQAEPFAADVELAGLGADEGVGVPAVSWRASSEQRAVAVRKAHGSASEWSAAWVRKAHGSSGAQRALSAER